MRLPPSDEARISWLVEKLGWTRDQAVAFVTNTPHTHEPFHDLDPLEIDDLPGMWDWSDLDGGEDEVRP
jgi:hypothetical protein